MAMMTFQRNFIDFTEKLVSGNMEFNFQVKLVKGIGPRMEMQDYGCIGSSADKQFSWVLICDGIGGNSGGGLAAKTTVRYLNSYLKRNLINEQQVFEKDFFEKGIKLIRKKFTQIINNDTSFQFMGCTLCLAVFFHKQVHVLWSGDARFYLFRIGQCFWDTIPHNWSFDLYRKDVLSLAEARLSEISCLTGSINNYCDQIRFDSQLLHLKKNDRMLICTDGIWSLFEHPDLTQTINTYNLSKTAAYLGSFLKANANDNYFGFLIDC